MKLTLLKRKIEAPGVESFFFEPSAPITWEPGQFLHYVLHHRPTDDRGSDRWFTIAAAPFEKHVAITTRFAGEKGSSFKRTLADLKVGEIIEATEIDGDFTFDAAGKEHVFIAGGIGVTPFRAILADLDRAGSHPDITLLYANRDEHVVYREELERFAKNNPNLKVHYIFDPERIDVPRVQSVVSDMGRPIFYVSGPEPMVDALGNALKAAGVPEGHLKQDWFPGYLEG